MKTLLIRDIERYLKREKSRYKEEYWPYYELWSAVIIDAVRDTTINNYKEESMINLCDMLGIDSEFIIESCKKQLRRVK
jgi:hypothetical protein